MSTFLYTNICKKCHEGFFEGSCRRGCSESYKDKQFKVFCKNTRCNRTYQDPKSGFFQRERAMRYCPECRAVRCGDLINTRRTVSVLGSIEAPQIPRQCPVGKSCEFMGDLDQIRGHVQDMLIRQAFDSQHGEGSWDKYCKKA